VEEVLIKMSLPAAQTWATHYLDCTLTSAIAAKRPNKFRTTCNTNNKEKTLQLQPEFTAAATDVL
jgi:hypothetical protein